MTYQKQKNMVKELRRYYNRINNYGVKKAPFMVLLETKMPAILIEASFISNSMESKRLKTSNYRNKVAYGIFKGIKNYIKKLK